MTSCQSTRESPNMVQTSWGDVRAAHWFAKRPGTRAEENSSLAVIIFVRCQLRWDSTNKIIDEYLDTELGVDWIDAYLE